MALQSESAGDAPEKEDLRQGAAEEGSTTAGEGDAEEEEYITGVKLWLILGALTATTFLLLLDMSIVSTAVPKITTTFNSLSHVGWYGAAYNLCGAALQPLAGKLYTHLRSKWTYLCFLFLFEIGSLICGLATSSNMLIVGRAVAGMGSAGLLNGALTIVAYTVPLHKRPLITGILMGISNMGVVSGPLVGGALTEYSTWRWCFYINLPIGGAVAVLLAMIHIPDKIATPLPLLKIPPRLDLPGFVLFAPATIMFLLALQFGGSEHAWDSSVIIGLFVGAGVAILAFGFWERRVGDDDAMIPLGLFRRRVFWTSALVGAFNFSVTLVGSYYLPMYFQSVRGKSPFNGGVAYLPSVLSQLVAAVVTGALTTKLGYYLPWVFFGAVFAAVGSGLISTWTPFTAASAWIGYQIILGVGRGSSLQMHIIAIQANVPSSMLSVSMAMLVFSQTLACAVSLTIGELIFSEGLGRNLAKYAPSVDAETVQKAGGTGFRVVVGGDELPGVLKAFSESISEVMCMCAAFSSMVVFLGWGMGWVDIRKKTGKKGEV
ncbi:MFS multidrug transporter [Colletotrichum truncatum]|uniref:MFS multidrug transporter n=1 Tax=Colletotrichum truncatum TaxID=5467 RepID=A0ACC3ZL53_COLTU